MNENEIKQLEQEILKHKKLYYMGEAIISDEEYDNLEQRLRLVKPDSKILELVGSSVESKGRIKHAQKMLSLDKTYNILQLNQWISGRETIACFKIDGSSCSIVYYCGQLMLAKTRGDGVYGENIISKIEQIKNIPKYIDEKTEFLEVRGEIYITEENFIKLRNEMENHKLPLPESQRNIVAGLLGRKEHHHLCQYLDFQAFEVIGLSNVKKEADKLNQLNELGFQVPSYTKLTNEKELIEFLEQVEEFMVHGHYLIDGAVITYNDISLHDQLGYTSHHPKYKIAFKFQGETKITEIKQITWQVSRNGVLTPVAEVKPVELSGAKISRVTLHNLGMVNSLKLKNGDSIEIVRSGEVIPKFLRRVASAGINSYFIPEKCPSCSGKLEIEQIRLNCSNAKCPGRVIEEIEFFCKSIGIDDLSRKRLEEMMKKGLINSIPSLFKLNIEDLLKLDKVKEKLASKLINNILKAKEVDLVTFITSLGIQGLGKSKSEKIKDYKYDTLDKWFSLSVNDLLEIDGFAQKSAEDIIFSFNEKKELIKELLDVGIIIRDINVKKDSAISNKKICITGSLSRKRSEIEEMIKINSGIVVSSVSTNTDYLLTNDTDPSSSKYKKALQCDTEIISEEQFMTLISRQ